MRTKKETKYESYNCPLLGGTAQITLEYLIHLASGMALRIERYYLGLIVTVPRYAESEFKAEGEPGPLIGKNVFIPFIENESKWCLA